MSAARTVTLDFAADAEAILLSVQLDAELASQVFADAQRRAVRPSDIVENALREHYARLNAHG